MSISDAMPDPILEMKGISKRFAGVQALKDVSLKLYPAEVIALIGENGAGKSTLMKTLGGVHQPDEGEILINGKPVKITGVKDSIRAGISFIHQELNVLDNLDVAGNVYLGREPLRGPLRLIDTARMAADTQPFLDQLGLNVSSRTPLKNLSLAQQQMVEIAKALSLNSRILIMDEPTSSLTLSETDRLLTVVEDLRSKGVSVIYISHRLGEIKRIADRVIGLRDGRNAGGLSRAEISHDSMIKLMVGRDIDKTHMAHDTSALPVRFSVSGLRTRKYPQKEVEFEIRRGEILGMAGLVGAGRSEAAQAIFGIDSSLAGTFTLDGKKLSIKSASDGIKNGIYLVPEDRRRCGLITDLPIRNNITLPALNRYAVAGLVNGDKERVSAQKASKALNVKTPSVEFLAKNLSGGNQQKVVLAKWLSLEPKLMIFDEPTRGIDVGAKAEIYELMRNLAKEGVAILMISSDMEEVLSLSDRVAVMHEGRVTGILPFDKCSEESIMQFAVGGERPATGDRPQEQGAAAV
ncbi:MAG: sugar ABC transporter ATP-binding protein [Capsulimonas sp.]|uniref:sugar ABC transporter ATP-binding protein n=1 Tax=Capsulimonas sp. TaxID=2494211 RepID=UPI0032674F25